MPRMKFTTRALSSLKPSEKRIEYWDEYMQGNFGLRVNVTGNKFWIVMYRVHGKLRRYTIGKFRDIPLAEARAQAKMILSEASRGIDASEQKQQHKKAETFKELSDEYIEKHAKPNKKTWREDQRSIQVDLFPHWENRKAKDIKRRDVLILLDEIINRGSPIQANRILALIRKIYNFGIQRDIVEHNPCLALSRPINEKPRQGQRVLSFDELRRVWKALEQQNRAVASIFKLRILTAQRGIEIRAMKWDHIDFETCFWTIPPELAKNKLQHRVPLSSQALRVLKELYGERNLSPYVFPSPKNPNMHINNIRKAVDRITALSDVHFVDRDLRRTVASHLTGQLNVPRLVVSKILNHVESGVTKVYDRHSYDREKKEALGQWGNLLSEILRENKEEESNVLILEKQG